MEIFKTIRTVAIIGLMPLTLGACASSAQLDSGDMTHWQATYDGIRDMTPKWGLQGVEPIKASLDAGVDITFVDVRTPTEWAGGVIPGALLISLNELPMADKVAMLPTDKNKIIAVYCKSGHRGALALALLHQLGYKNAINMKGGWVGWTKAGYPVAKEPAVAQ